MTFESRVTIASGVLALGALLHFAFVQYLEAAGPMPTIHLKHDLTEFPTQLSEWQGVDLPQKNEGYGDDNLFRTYENPDTKQALTLWMVYSEVGEDRGHHPEVCLKVAGNREDTRVRNALPVEGHGSPIQQYRFVAPDGSSQWVFYWHYTLMPPRTGANELQLKYQRMHKRPSSLTIEVFAPETVIENADGAREFVRLVDHQIQQFVGPYAIRGSKRINVMVVDEEARPEDH